MRLCASVLRGGVLRRNFRLSGRGSLRVARERGAEGLGLVAVVCIGRLVGVRVIFFFFFFFVSSVERETRVEKERFGFSLTRPYFLFFFLNVAIGRFASTSFNLELILESR